MPDFAGWGLEEWAAIIGVPGITILGVVDFVKRKYVWRTIRWLGSYLWNALLAPLVVRDIRASRPGRLEKTVRVHGFRVGVSEVDRSPVVYCDICFQQEERLYEVRIGDTGEPEPKFEMICPACKRVTWIRSRQLWDMKESVDTKRALGIG